MDCFRIRYQRGSDILDIKFEGNGWDGFELNDFYKLRDGYWKEIDKTYDKNTFNEFKIS